MNELSTLDDYGVVSEPATLTFQRVLPGPIERIWSYVTDSELRGRWLATGEMTLEVGAPFELVWRNERLTGHAEDRSHRANAGHRMQGRITELDPPRHIAFTWSDTGDVSIDLVPQGKDVLLTLVHRRVADPAMRLDAIAGWHAHLDFLVDRARGVEPDAPFRERWSRLRGEYERRFPA